MQLELDQRQLLSTDLDRRDPVVRFEPLSLARWKEDGFGRRLAAPRGRIDAVETALLAAVARSQAVGETAVRRVEVEEDRRRRAPEAVHDLGRRADERIRLELLVLVVDEDRKPALEHVERVRMPAVVVRVGAVSSLLRGVEAADFASALARLPKADDLAYRVVSHPEAHLHVEFYPAYRMRGRLKYLAGSELGAGVFTADTDPDEKAAELRAKEKHD